MIGYARATPTRTLPIYPTYLSTAYLSYLKAWVVTNDRWTDHGRHSRQVHEAGLPESSWATRHP